MTTLTQAQKVAIAKASGLLTDGPSMGELISVAEHVVAEHVVAEHVESRDPLEARIRALHREDTRFITGEPWCAHCLVHYPCPTIALMDEPEANVFMSGVCKCGLPVMHADWGLACADPDETVKS